ncbi:MAG TPA: dihydropteroate synthase [Acidobacteriaceae bacterium]|nr:dihydropteroate synthase [Acidobacteriaceae bacterium]
MTFPSRPLFDWSLRTRSLPLGRQTLIMGILNVTPDSFSDGGCYSTPETALHRALELLDEGADILDIGGESTRPGASPLSSSEEQARVLPVIEAVLKRRPDAIVSIDTYHADTARFAVQTGAEIVNDVSGHLWDPDMAAICAELECGAVLMHTRGRPAEWKQQPSLAPEEVVPLVLEGLRQQANRAVDSGMNPSKIVLDPGFGFGKIREENYPLLAGFAELGSLGFPLLAGLSRKSFLRAPDSSAPNQSVPEDSILASTLAANTTAILAGAHIVRVHDVAEAKAATNLVDAILSRDPG